MDTPQVGVTTDSAALIAENRRASQEALTQQAALQKDTAEFQMGMSGLKHKSEIANAVANYSNSLAQKVGRA